MDEQMPKPGLLSFFTSTTALIIAVGVGYEYGLWALFGAMFCTILGYAWGMDYGKRYIKVNNLREVPDEVDCSVNAKHFKAVSRGEECPICGEAET